MIKLLLIFITLLSSYGLADSCERAAYVDFEKILIDSSSSIKGDGLKGLIEKDPKALAFLNTYQENGKPSKYAAAISSAGFVIGLGGYLFGKNSGVLNKNILLGTGISIVLGNFLFRRAKQAKNEKNLLNAIYEYNLRNTPKIYFTPYKNGNKGDNIGIGIGVNKKF